MEDDDEGLRATIAAEIRRPAPGILYGPGPEPEPPRPTVAELEAESEALKLALGSGRGAGGEPIGPPRAPFPWRQAGAGHPGPRRPAGSSCPCPWCVGAAVAPAKCRYCTSRVAGARVLGRSARWVRRSVTLPGR